MEDKNTTYFKKKLEAELKTIEQDLKTVGRQNPENPGDWEPTQGAMEIQGSDANEVADKFESFEENVALLRQFEIRLAEVKAALERIAKGSYGKCSECQQPIEEARLEANPAATTCKKHMG